jgi:hypothetical protein
VGRAAPGSATAFSAARELHTALCEALISSEPDVEERIRGLAETIGNHLEVLEAEVFS